MLDAFKPEVHRLLREEPRLPAVRVRELIAPLGFAGAQTIVNEYVREVRPLFLSARTYQRTVYRPGEICQFDLWRPSVEIPVGFGQSRVGYVVVACLGYSRAGAGALIAGPPLSELLISPRGPELRESPLPPAGTDTPHQLADSRPVETPRIARSPVKAGLRAAQHKGLHAFRVRDREQDSQRAALTGAQHVGSLDTDRIQHRPRVLHPLL